MLSHFRTFLQSSERDLQGKEGSNVEGEKGAWDLIKTESDVIHEKKKKKAGFNSWRNANGLGTSLDKP